MDLWFEASDIGASGLYVKDHTAKNDLTSIV